MIYFLCILDFKFSTYPASMLACASLCVALNGMKDRKWCEQFRLSERLTEITKIDFVSLKTHSKKQLNLW